MKRIGDVMRDFPLPERPQQGGAVRIRSKDTVRCPICNDAGYLRADVPVGHPSFGRLFPCECKQRELDERRDDELRKRSTLEAFGDSTFDTFDPDIPGLEEAYEAALAFAQEPGHNWLFL